MKSFLGPDGTTWGVDIQAPGSSNALILFRHPDGRSSRLDRYNWVINQGPEARSVTSRVDPAIVLEQLDVKAITRLFARAMPVSQPDALSRQAEVETA